MTEPSLPPGFILALLMSSSWNANCFPQRTAGLRWSFHALSAKEALWKSRFFKSHDYSGVKILVECPQFLLVNLRKQAHASTNSSQKAFKATLEGVLANDSRNTRPGILKTRKRVRSAHVLHPFPGEDTRKSQVFGSQVFGSPAEFVICQR